MGDEHPRSVLIRLDTLFEFIDQSQVGGPEASGLDGARGADDRALRWQPSVRIEDAGELVRAADATVIQFAGVDLKQSRRP